jgi:hypothetical protein
VVDASCTVSPDFADCIAALITVWSFEPVGLKEVPGPTLIIEPEQFAEKKHTNKNKAIKMFLIFVLSTYLFPKIFS